MEKTIYPPALQLGKLEKVDLRHIWTHEALDFTQWLAREENVQLLSDEIGIQLSEVRAEVGIGGYQVDMVAEDEDSGRKVIIENQLEQTDHRHLGQLITYAAGYDASYIIWIVKDAREEHQKAVEWLNNHTGSDLSFFLIKMELWKIGESLAAPKFNLLVEPNDWAKTLQQNQAETREYTELKLKQMEFWKEFISYGESGGTPLRLGRKPRAQHWFNISFGTSEAHLSLTVNSREEYMGCEVYMPKSERLYQRFCEQREAIEAAMEEELEWMPLEGKKAFRIKATQPMDFEDEARWPHYFEWMHRTAVQMQHVFGRYI